MHMMQVLIYYKHDTSVVKSIVHKLIVLSDGWSLRIVVTCKVSTLYLIQPLVANPFNFLVINPTRNERIKVSNTIELKS